MRDVKFIDHEPPPQDHIAGGKKGKAKSTWTPYVFGVLSQQPGRWALIESTDIGSDRSLIKRAAIRYGISAEVLTRQGRLYARVTA